MKIYIVTQSWVIYSDYTEVIIGVVSSMKKAKELAMKAKPTYDDIIIAVECFELDGEQHNFSKAEIEAYKFPDTFNYNKRIVLNMIE